jgi:hypothetical protein
MKMKIFNVNVYGLEQSVIASGYPMRSEEIPEMTPEDFAGEKDIERATKLGTAKTGSGHNNFLKGIIVQFDLTYPNYFTPQLQRYNFVDIVSSTSKMHRLTKMDVAGMCNQHVDESVIENLNSWIRTFNLMQNLNHEEVIVSKIKTKLFDGESDNYGISHTRTHKRYSFGRKSVEELVSELADDEIFIESETLTKHEVFMRIVSNTPMGLEQTMRISTNYLQLRTIYEQRKNHKLKDDWGVFCDWCETLPYFKEFCIKK